MSGSVNILVFRFSALGDVAMTVPVIKCLLQQYPQLQITFVSVPFHQPLFDDIERLQFYGADVKKQFNGLNGLRKLASQLKQEILFDAVADLHNVLRTKALRLLLRANKVAVIDKGRKEKKTLTRTKNKQLRPLKTTFQRYADVFEQLGYPVDLTIKNGIQRIIPDTTLINIYNSNTVKIGIAPFAKHAAKMYPLKKMQSVISILLKDKQVAIYLFGSKAEEQIMTQWEVSHHEQVQIIAGKFSFREEINIMSQMDVMLTMDSANMHLASLLGIPVVSIWGGTHPFTGFYGWGQSMENAIQEDLPCRPSSVFGNKDCPVHGKAGCMQDIQPETVAKKLQSIYANHKKI